jgi:hypothetical protein
MVVLFVLMDELGSGRDRTSGTQKTRRLREGRERKSKKIENKKSNLQNKILSTSSKFES